MYRTRSKKVVKP